MGMDGHGHGHGSKQTTQLRKPLWRRRGSLVLPGCALQSMNQSKFLACLETALLLLLLLTARLSHAHPHAIGGWAEMKYRVFGMCDMVFCIQTRFQRPTLAHISNFAPPSETSTCTAFLRDSALPNELSNPKKHAASIQSLPNL
jgi:hypothetical protein